MASVEAAAPGLNISVAYSPRAGEVDQVELRLPAGATVADAVRASGLQARHPQAALETLPVGIWGAFCTRDAVLRDRDRVELYRPLRVDPKEARRRRQRAQVTPRR
jgi:putative ubiquitin-RnfH superfamily antitoxin RatB of RatAB toxin-antitoxin module